MDEKKGRRSGLEWTRRPFSVRGPAGAALVLALLAGLASPALADPTGPPAAKAPDPAAATKPHIIVLPIIYYSPETRLAFGAGALMNYRLGGDKKNTRPSSVGLLAIYTLNKQVQLSLRPEVYLPGNTFMLGAELGYELYPQDFYGIGNDTSDANVESYTPETLDFKFLVKRKIFGSIFVGVNYQVEKTIIRKVKPDGMLASGTIPGSQGGIISGFGFSLSWDDRDNVFFPRRGYYVQLGADFYSDAFGSDYSYTAARLDFRTYLSLFERHVLALRFYLRSMGGGTAPFYQLSTLGGSTMLRGVYAGKFRDQAQLTVLGEYRFPVWKRLSAAGFTGIGNVATSVNGLLHNALRVSAGAGVRFRVDTREGTNVRLDYAWCSGSTGLYMTIQEAF